MLSSRASLLILQFILLILVSFWVLSLGPSELRLHLFGIGWSEVESLIFTQARLPRFIVAFLASALLGVSGLFMQSYFQNPLVGPYILGVQSGAALSVALSTLLLGTGSAFVSQYQFSTFLSAGVGSLAMLFLMTFLAHLLRQKVMLLIIGLLLGQLCAGIVSLLAILARAEDLKAFVVWGLGSFDRLAFEHLAGFSSLALFLLALSFLFIKPLDLMLLGEDYAKSLGLNLRALKFFFLLLAGLMSALVSATCGPIAFLGLLAPHITRSLFKTQKHLWLIPGTIMSAGLIGIFVQGVSLLFAPHQLPINISLGLMSAPVLGFFLMRLGQRGGHV